MKRKLLACLALLFPFSGLVMADSPEREEAAALVEGLGAGELPQGEPTPEFLWWLRLADSLQDASRYDDPARYAQAVTSCVVLATNPNMAALSLVSARADNLGDIGTQPAEWRLFILDIASLGGENPVFYAVAFYFCDRFAGAGILTDDLNTPEYMNGLLRQGAQVGDGSCLRAEAYNNIWGFYGGADEALALQDISRCVARELRLSRVNHRSCAALLTELCRRTENGGPLRIVSALECVSENGEATPADIYLYVQAVLDMDPACPLDYLKTMIVLPELLSDFTTMDSEVRPVLLHLSSEALLEMEKRMAGGHDGDIHEEAMVRAKDAGRDGYRPDRDYLRPRVPVYNITGGSSINLNCVTPEERACLRPLFPALLGIVENVQHEGARLFLQRWMTRNLEGDPTDEDDFEQLRSMWESSLAESGAEGGESAFCLYTLYSTGVGARATGVDPAKAAEYLQLACEAGYAPAIAESISLKMDCAETPTEEEFKFLASLLPDPKAAFLCYRILQESNPADASVYLSMALWNHGYDAWKFLRDIAIQDPKADEGTRLIAAAYAATADGYTGQDWLLLDKCLQRYAGLYPETLPYVKPLRMMVLDNACNFADCIEEAAPMLIDLAREFLTEDEYVEILRRLDAEIPTPCSITAPVGEQDDAGLEG